MSRIKRHERLSSLFTNDALIPKLGVNATSVLLWTGWWSVPDHLGRTSFPTVSKPHQNLSETAIGVVRREEQIPQVVGKAEKTRNGMDGLEGNFTLAQGSRLPWSPMKKWQESVRGWPGLVD